MERKTKEQLLSAAIKNYNSGVTHVHAFALNQKETDVFTDAMQAYADQEMALFAEWIADNGYYIFHTGWAKSSFAPGITTHQLIDKYYEK